jgi:hypothetical protein
VALGVVVDAAEEHGQQGEALEGDAVAEHPVHARVVAALPGPVGVREGRHGQDAADRDQGLLLELARDLLEGIFVVEITAGVWVIVSVAGFHGAGRAGFRGGEVLRALQRRSECPRHGMKGEELTI